MIASSQHALDAGKNRFETGLMLTHVDAAADLKQQTTPDTNYTPVDRFTLSYAPTGASARSTRRRTSSRRAVC